MSTVESIDGDLRGITVRLHAKQGARLLCNGRRLCQRAFTVRDYMQGKFEEHALLERGGNSLECEWVHLRFNSRQRS